MNDLKTLYIYKDIKIKKNNRKSIIIKITRSLFLMVAIFCDIVHSIIHDGENEFYISMIYQFN